MSGCYALAGSFCARVFALRALFSSSTATAVDCAGWHGGLIFASLMLRVAQRACCWMLSCFVCLYVWLSQQGSHLRGVIVSSGGHPVGQGRDFRRGRIATATHEPESKRG